MRVEEEAQPGREPVDVEPAGQAELHVAEAVGQGEGQLLRGGRTRLPDVVAGDAERLVRRDPGRAVLHQVADQPQVRLRGEQPLLLGDVLLEDVGLQRAVEQRRVHALPLGRDDVEAEDRDRGPGDGHRGGHGAQVDPVEQHVEVGRRVDRHPAVPDLAEAARVVGVAAHQGRHVEGHAQPAAALAQDHLVALVGLPRVAETGELPDGPRPAAVARRVQPPGEGELPRPADPLHPLVGRLVLRPVDRVDLDPGQRGEVRVPDLARLLGPRVRRLPAFPSGLAHA